MKTFIQLFDEFMENHDLTPEQEIELVDHILDKSNHTSQETYAKSCMDYDSILDLILSNEFLDNLLEDTSPQNQDIVLSTITPDKLAYHLSYEDTEYGSKLLDELLYYRSMGRI